LLALQVLLLFLLAHPRVHIVKVLAQTCPGGLCLRQLRMERGILRLSLRLALLDLAQALLHTPLASPSLRLEALVALATERGGCGDGKLLELAQSLGMMCTASLHAACP
jgi:hypothetical protein